MGYVAIKGYPLVIDNITFGDIFDNGGAKELIIWRSQKNFYRSIPCHSHGKCPGFTVRTQAINAAINQGVKILKVNFKPTKDVRYIETYVCNLKLFSKSAITVDNAGFQQYSMPKHKFIEACNKA